MKNNIGFDNRKFLTKHEWNTYIKRMPVRYIKKKKTECCEICGEKATAENPFESSHIIGFKIGVVYFGLTPDFLDCDDNIVTAHKRKCNSKAEISKESVCQRLSELGIKELPSFLPEEIIELWSKLIK